MSQGEEKDEHLVSLKVEDVMIRDVVTIDANSTVREAANVMSKMGIGCLIVIRRNKAVGILTGRDVLKRVVAEVKDAEKTLVNDVMSSPLITVKPHVDLEEAVRLMFSMNIKRLPVVDGERLLGIVSLTDIARCHPHIMKLLKQYAADYTRRKT
ncbi:MAG: CBS domain-containing protein [Nitrososphaerota archaeon]|nr:CBS domain-containing protein [Candidatus Bathyarchaeota archaeon]MDW8194356.1 CBS domain-containing protein [Nitrososphaerota archaeon]